MKKNILALGLLLFLFSCAETEYQRQFRAELESQEFQEKQAKEMSKFRVFVFRHPDYHFQATDLDSVKIYDGFEPTREYFIIGKIIINEAENANQYYIEREIRRTSSALGGEAVIITASNIETKEFSGDKTGFIIPRKSWIEYWEFQNQGIEVSVKRRYGYIVRWK